MNPSLPRRLGAAFTLSLLMLALAALPPGAIAADEPADAPGKGTPRAEVPAEGAADAPVKGTPRAKVAEGAATAPADGLRHGSRAKASDGTLVVYDKVHGVHLVPDRKHTYWVADRFYQYENGVWLAATIVAGPWELTSQRLVPDPALRRYGPLHGAVTARLPSGREAVYEPRLKVYKVAGRKGVFLHDGLYYRYDGGVWLESAKDEGPWAPTSMKILPAPLRRAVPAPEAGQTVTLPSGETVIFDENAKLFTVQANPDKVLFDGTFYEKRDTKWFASTGAASALQEVAPTRVPAPVRMNFRKPGPNADKANARNKGDKAGDDGKAAGEKRRDTNKAAAGTHEGKHAKQKATGDEVE